jgi:hypothetical protein
LVFKVKEISSITVKGNGYERAHREITDAMEKTINWLANQPVGTKVSVLEATVIKRIE